VPTDIGVVQNNRLAARPEYLEPQLAPHLQDENHCVWRLCNLLYIHFTASSTVAQRCNLPPRRSSKATGSTSQSMRSTHEFQTSAHCYLLFCAALPPAPLLLACVPHRYVRGPAELFCERVKSADCAQGRKQASGAAPGPPRASWPRCTSGSADTRRCRAWPAPRMRWWSGTGRCRRSC